MRSRSKAALYILAAGSLSIAACTAPAKQEEVATPPPAATAPPVTSPLSINEEMVRIVDHAAHQLWNVEKEKMAPKTDADWENLREHATQIAASGVLIRVEGSGVSDREWVQQADWQKWATAVSNAGVAAGRAVEGKNMEALVAANGQLVDACESCHRQYKPSLPSEGISHSHLH